MKQKEIRRQRILTQPVLPLLIKTAIPTMIGMLVSLLYNVTDTFWIGILGNRSMTAAVGVVFAFVSVIQAVGFWFGYGSGNVMSRLLGAGEEEEAGIIAADGAALAIGSGILLLILCLPMPEKIAQLLGGGASLELLRYTTEYLRIILLMIPFSLYATTLYNQIRLCGNVRDAMLGLLVGMFANIVLDPLFILGFHMEIAGAALATLLGYILSTIVIFVLSGRHGNIPAKLRNVRFTRGRIYHILSGGAPNFSRQGITSLAAVLLNRAAAGYGETLIAALTVAGRVSALSYMLMIGFGQGFQPICAMNYGAKQFDRVKKALKLTVSIGTGFLIPASALTAVFAPALAGLLSRNPDVVETAAVIIRWQCLSMPLMACYALSSMFLQNVGRYFSALFVSVCRQGIVFLPLLLILPALLGEKGFYLLQPLSDIISALLSLLLVARLWKGIFTEEEQCFS